MNDTAPHAMTIVVAFCGIIVLLSPLLLAYARKPSAAEAVALLMTVVAVLIGIGSSIGGIFFGDSFGLGIFGNFASTLYLGAMICGLAAALMKAIDRHAASLKGIEPAARTKEPRLTPAFPSDSYRLPRK